MKALIAGTGSFAEKTHRLLERHQVLTLGFVDEFRSGEYRERPVHTAAALPHPWLQDKQAVFLLAISNAEHADAARRRLQERGVLAGRILGLADDSALLVLDRILESHPSLLLEQDSAGAEGFCTMERTAFPLPAVQPDQISFRIFNRGRGFLSHLADLPRSLARNHPVEILCDESLEPEHGALLCSQQRASRRPASLVISPQTFPCSPDSTPRLTLLHAIYDSVMLRDSIATALAQPRRHYVGLASRPSFRQFQDICRANDLRNVVLLPLGYPKLDRAMAAYRPLPGRTPRTLLYAPTQCVTRKQGLDAGYSIDQALDFVPTLLEADPELNIIYRPHPEDLSLLASGFPSPTTGIMGELESLARRHPRLQWDRNPGQGESYAQADALLTDTSSTAFSFAFTTGKPVLFHSSRDRELLAQAGHLDFIRDRGRVGRICGDTRQLQEALPEMLAAPESFARSITELREQTIFNVGRAEAACAEAVEAILAARPRNLPAGRWSLES